MPNSRDTWQALAILGMSIFEATAWGTLFSLLLKRPLVAAIVTLVVGAIGVNVAVNTASSAAVPSANPAAYIDAVPLRCAIVLAVLGLSALVARGWLSPKSERIRLALHPQRERFAAIRARMGALRARTSAPTDTPRRSSMLARLLWQTWRESWKVLGVPIVLATLCLVAVMILHAAQSASEWFAAATIFFAPALYGALAFSADQRRGQVKYLAEHAASPRFVWMSRQIVWLGTLVTLAVALSLLMVVVCIGLWQYRAQQGFRTIGVTFRPTYFQLYGLLIHSLTIATLITSLGIYGLLAAYSIGQFCSMLLRSEILAGFLALVFAVVLSAWVALLFVWQLSGWLFLLPIIIGFMLATWLRTPAWVVGRNTWRAWVMPALVVAFSLAVVAVCLPEVRLNQIRHVPPPPLDGIGTVVTSSPEAEAFFKKRKAENEATAAMYLKAAALLRRPVRNDLLKKWLKPEYEYAGSHPGTIDEYRIPEDQREAFLAAKRKQMDMLFEQRQEAIKLAIEASKRPTCQFDFPASTILAPSYQVPNKRDIPGDVYEQLEDLLNTLIYCDSKGNIGGNASFEQLLAALRMSAHMRMGQPTVICIHVLESGQKALKRIGAWAIAKDRTNEERRNAILQLQQLFRHQSSLGFGGFFEDERLIGDVISGKELPFVLSAKPVPISTYLAFLANRLPWERKRAFKALDLITKQNIHDGRELEAFIRSAVPRMNGFNTVQQWVRPTYQPAWVTEQPAAATSYLVRLEYEARVPVNELFRSECEVATWRRATLIKIALIMYRHDHGEYPATLAGLVPTYLKHEPLDPYSMQSFSYRPLGLDAPLSSYADSVVEIDAHAPLFWSVGPNNVRLIRHEPVRRAGDAEHHEATIPELKLSGGYTLDPSEEWYAPDATALVFGLPH